MSDAFNFADVLCDPVTVRTWVVNKLPNDIVSVTNAVSLHASKRWPLCIDPQGQAREWIKQQHTDATRQGSSRGSFSKSFKVLTPSTSSLARQLQAAVSKGHTVLMENVGERLDPILEPILLRQTYV